ncbi:hypothetical protein [Acidovorax sp. FJL06]|uniref:hypothetical protein n=1 Tax=Acidovorax sp. FJL06 TaxID=2153365 RepID=UPI000F584D27|nr:hypothetical protein [Acidovorax sp. FJL06]RQO82866.1 hypothetical protein DBV10_07025 [Acidovorax sp. FJL06]
MVLVKTQAGQEALKDRRGSLSSRQRSAFILFDGKRTTGEILAATAAMGITQDDVQTMIAQGLLAPLSGQHLPAAAAVAAVAAATSMAPTPGAVEAPGTDLGTIASPVEGSGRSPKERYQAAYPIATELTAGLGLRGFRLNLAVEGAGNFDDLAALAPKIREAVGDARFERLDQALFD